MAENFRVTPFQDIWQSIAGGMGITTQRMHRRMLEDEAALALVDRTISEQLMQAAQFATNDIDREQLARVADEQAQLRALAGHSDPNVRRAALTQMAGIGERTGTWLEDVESRQEELGQRQYDLRLERRKELKDELSGNFKTLRNLDAEYNKVIGLLNTLGDKDPAVQSAFRNLIGTSFAEVRGDEGVRVGLSLPGLGNVFSAQVGEGEDTTYTKDQIIAAATAWRNAQADTLKNLIKELNTQAEKDGFKVNTETGDVEVEDLNTGIFEDMLLQGTDPTNATPPNLENDTLWDDLGQGIDSLREYLGVPQNLEGTLVGAGLGAAGGATNAMRKLWPGPGSVGASAGFWKKLWEVLKKFPVRTALGAARGGGWGLAAGLAYDYLANPPPKMPGETQLQYETRLLQGIEEAQDQLWENHSRRPTND